MICVQRITITPQNIYMLNNRRYTGLHAEVLPANATCKNVKWKSSNPDIVSINESTGVMYSNAPGSVRITAEATDCSGVSARVHVTVIQLVSNITLDYSSATVEVGETKRLTATISPSDATNQNINWESANTNIATVNEYGLITGISEGTTTITATAADDSGTYATCNISITPISVKRVEVSPQEKTLYCHETFTPSATIYPDNAYNKSIVWSSSKSSVAEVDEETGIVTAKSGGKATITATTVSGNKTDTCKITVDPREKVKVKKDSHSFYVEFSDGQTWKNIGIDLSKRNEYYTQLKPPALMYQKYNELIEEEQRYIDNVYISQDVKKTYSVKQIAYLYLLDPLGIEYYMRNHACSDMELGAELFFKDSVYKEIFGVWPRLIKVFPDKTIQYYAYSSSISAEDRADFYTDAEILFGEHPIYDPLSLISFLLDVVPSVSLSLFSIFYPPAGVVLGSIDLVKFLFFSASASGVLSSGANSIMEDYTSNVYTLSNGESAGVKAGKAMGWVNFIFGTFSTILDAAEVFTPSINDITVYNQVNKGDYITTYIVNGSELSMEDIIARIS